MLIVNQKAAGLYWALSSLSITSMFDTGKQSPDTGEHVNAKFSGLKYLHQ